MEALLPGSRCPGSAGQGTQPCSGNAALGSLRPALKALHVKTTLGGCWPSWFPCGHLCDRVCTQLPLGTSLRGVEKPAALPVPCGGPRACPAVSGLLLSQLPPQGEGRTNFQRIIFLLLIQFVCGRLLASLCVAFPSFLQSPAAFPFTLICADHP